MSSILQDNPSPSPCSELSPFSFDFPTVFRCDILFFCSSTILQSEGVLERRFVFVCANNAVIWLSISYAYKGLLQLVAMFMAFHTRKVKIKALNDSKEIGAIVYINSIILVLLAVTELALRQYHYLYSALNGTILLIGGSLFLGLVFIPKVSYYGERGEGRGDEL